MSQSTHLLKLFAARSLTCSKFKPLLRRRQPRSFNLHLLQPAQHCKTFPFICFSPEKSESLRLSTAGIFIWNEICICHKLSRTEESNIAAVKQKRLSWLRSLLTNIQAMLDALAREGTSSSLLWIKEKIPFDSDVKKHSDVFLLVLFSMCLSVRGKCGGWGTWK